MAYQKHNQLLCCVALITWRLRDFSNALRLRANYLLINLTVAGFMKCEKTSGQESLALTNYSCKWLVKSFCQSFLLCAFLFANMGIAQVKPTTAPWEREGWKPSQVQINQYLANMLLCDFSGSGPSRETAGEQIAISKYFGELPISQSNGGFTQINFTAFGTDFDSIFIGGGGDGANAEVGVFAWSPTGNVSAIIRSLTAINLKMVGQKKDFGRKELLDVFTASTVTADLKKEWVVATGHVVDETKSQLTGVSFGCSAKQPTDAEVLAFTGLPSMNSLSRRLSEKEEISKNELDQIIRRGNEFSVHLVAAYPLLDSDQIKSLLASQYPGIRGELISNKRAKLSAEQIDKIISDNVLADSRRLVAARYDQLSEEQREQLAKSGIKP